MLGQCNWLTRHPYKMEILSSSLSPGTNKFENLKKLLYNIYIIIKEIFEMATTKKPAIKMDNEELNEYLLFRRRRSIVPAKKGKGMEYDRAKEKEKSRDLASD